MKDTNDLEDKRQCSFAYYDRGDADSVGGVFINWRFDDLRQQLERRDPDSRSPNRDSDTGTDPMYAGRSTRSKEAMPDADADIADTESDDAALAAPLNFGCGGKIRTSDPGFMRPLLYR